MITQRAGGLDVHRKTRRWQGFVVGILTALIVAAGLGLVAWFAVVSTLTITLMSGVDQQPLVGATVLVGTRTYTTSETGEVLVRRVGDQTIQLRAEAQGFQAKDATIALPFASRVREVVSLDPATAPKTDRQITVKNALSGAVVAGATLRVGEITQSTTSDGVATVALTDSDQVTVTADGYSAIQAVLGSDVVKTITLMPAGQVVFVSDRDGKRGLYVASYDGTRNESLIRRQADTEDYEPEFSPDRKWITFYSTRDEKKDTYGNQISLPYIMKADGSGVTKLSADRAAESLVWTTDSRYLYLVTRGSDTSRLERFDTRTQRVATILEQSGWIYSFRLSPNNKLIAYELEDTNDGLYVANADGSNAHRFADANTSIVRFNADNNLELELYESGARRDLVYFVDSKTVAEATHESINESRTTYLSPDRALEAFVDTRDGKTDLYVASRGGTNERRLTTIGTVVSYGYEPTWSTDGQYLTFGVSREAENAIYVVAASGGDAKKVVDASFGNVYEGY